MPSVDIRIYYSIREVAADPISRTISVGQEDLDIFFPPSSQGWGYWPRRQEAEDLAYSILKEEVFQDEVTPIENEGDLRRLGVTLLKLSFDSKDVGHNMGTTLIEHG
jgi:hypothetical protein